MNPKGVYSKFNPEGWRIKAQGCERSYPWVNVTRVINPTGLRRIEAGRHVMPTTQPRWRFVASLKEHLPG